tara:strand:- start:516 stop:842 length:327 start_codon:yes stop_codon:yes gene_type:complete
MKKMCIATLFSLVSLTAFSQIKVIHFNAGWNKANDVEWFDKLSDVTKKTLSIDDEDIQKKYEIFIVPTIIVFDEDEEVKRFQADLSFEMVATKKEIQEYIDELIISKF